MKQEQKLKYDRPSVDIIDLRAIGMSLSNQASPFVADVDQYIDGDGVEGEDQF